MKKRITSLMLTLVMLFAFVQIAYAGGYNSITYTNFSVNSYDFYNYQNTVIDGTGVYGLGQNNLPLGGASGTLIGCYSGNRPKESMGAIARIFDDLGNMTGSTTWVYNSTSANSVSTFVTVKDANMSSKRKYCGEGQTSVILSGMTAPAYVPTVASDYYSYP
jgi:hypothetical protein